MVGWSDLASLACSSTLAIFCATSHSIQHVAIYMLILQFFAFSNEIIHLWTQHGFWHFHFRPHTKLVVPIRLEHLNFNLASIDLSINLDYLSCNFSQSPPRNNTHVCFTIHRSFQSSSPFASPTRSLTLPLLVPPRLVVSVWLVGAPCVKGLLANFDHPLCVIQHPLTRHNMTIYLVILCSFKPCHLLKSPNLQLLVEILGLA